MVGKFRGKIHIIPKSHLEHYSLWINNTPNFLPLGHFSPISGGFTPFLGDLPLLVGNLPHFRGICPRRLGMRSNSILYATSTCFRDRDHGFGNCEWASHLRFANSPPVHRTGTRAVFLWPWPSGLFGLVFRFHSGTCKWIIVLGNWRQEFSNLFGIWYIYSAKKQKRV